MIAFIRLCWSRRNTPWYDLAEEYALLTKMARRCAYDLSHAAFSGNSPELADMYEGRARMWLKIFAPDGVKDYRHRLYSDIDKLEFRVERLREFCKKNGLDPEEVDDTQF